MTLNTVAGTLADDGLSAGTGGELSDLTELQAAVKELQRLKVKVVAGAAAVTNIAITGIATDDTILCVLRLDRDASAANVNLSDVTSEATIPTAGNLQLGTTNTTGDTLVVFYFDKA